MQDETTETPRPNPVALAEQMRSLAECWRELEPYTADGSAGAQAERVDSSEGTEHPAPGNWSAVALRADIHHAAHTWAKMLVDDRNIKPASGETDDLLKFAATYPGYFTNHEDAFVAQDVAYEAGSLLFRSTAILEPDDERRTPIGPCFEVDCGEKLLVKWTKGAGGDEEREWRLRSTPLVARCKRGHIIDAMLYAASTHA